MTIYKHALFLLSLLCLAACGREILLPQNPFSDDVDKAMQHVLADVIARDGASVLAASSDEFNAVDNVAAKLETILGYIPDDANVTELVAAQINKSDTTEQAFPIYLGSYEVTNGETYALVSLALEDPNLLDLEEDKLCCKLRNLKVTKYDESPSRIHDWNWKDKPITNYIFIGAAMIIPIFIIITFISCIRTKGIQRKWLWCLFILMGVYGLSLNWTTHDISLNFIDYSKDDGNFNFSLIKFNLFGASSTRAGIFQPWIIEIGAPIGAIIYWYKKTRGKFSGESVEDGTTEKDVTTKA